MSSEGLVRLADNGADTVDGLVAGADAPLVTIARGAVLFVLFNRPQARNALSRQMRRAFAAVLADAQADPSVRAVIVGGAGAAFCAGVDIKESRAAPAPMVRPHPGEALWAMTKPFVAAVHGACVGGGLEIALSCSFIIASDAAVFLDGHAEAGMFPAWGLSALLPRAVGVRRARQMMLTGMTVSAQLAHAWGLVNEMVAPQALLARCEEVALAMTQTDARLTAEQIELLRAAENRGLEEAIHVEAEAAARWRETPRS